MAENVQELSMFDLLLVAVENLRLVLLVPCLIGLVTFGGSYLLPKQFVSESILVLPMDMDGRKQGQMPVTLQTPVQAASLMVSDFVLDSVIESLGMSRGAPIAEVRERLLARTQATVGRDGMLRLAVTASEAAEAQAIANKIIDRWLATTLPGEQDRAEIEKRFASKKAFAESFGLMLGQLKRLDEKGLVEAFGRREFNTSIVALTEIHDRYVEDLSNISRVLRGYTRDVVKQPPTLPLDPLKPERVRLALIAVFAASAALLTWLFMRLSWRRAAQEPTVAQRQARVRAALGL